MIMFPKAIMNMFTKASQWMRRQRLDMERFVINCDGTSSEMCREKCQKHSGKFEKMSEKFSEFREEFPFWL